MRVLCLSGECDFLRQVETAFPDRKIKVFCGEDTTQFLESAEGGGWNAFIVDFDVLHPDYSDPMEFMKKLGRGSKILVVGSSSFANWHHELRLLGALVLDKPNTIGEIGLALRKLDSSRPRNAST